MGLRDILVHVDNRKPCPARVRAAIDLALAHPIGLYVVTDRHIPSSIKVQIGADVLAARAEAARERAARAETMFREQAEKAGVASEWLCEEGDRTDILSEQARFCDVAVIGQRDPDAREIAGPSNVPDHVVLSAGRPVLVVPHVGTYPSVGKRVMVAGDGSLPAARAVNDALPILRGAEKVNVITVYRHDVSADAGREPGERICRHPARHRRPFAALPCQRHRHRQRDSLPGGGRRRGPDCHGRRDPAHARTHDRSGADVPLKHGSAGRGEEPFLGVGISGSRSRRRPDSAGFSPEDTKA